MENHNSVTNQEIKSKFVQREVYCNVGLLVEYCLNKSSEGDQDAPFSWDDVENYYIYPEYYGTYDEFTLTENDIACIKELGLYETYTLDDMEGRLTRIV